MNKKILVWKKAIALLLTLVISTQWLPFISSAADSAVNGSGQSKPEVYHIYMSFTHNDSGHQTAIESVESDVTVGEKANIVLPDTMTDAALTDIKGLTATIPSDAAYDDPDKINKDNAAAFIENLIEENTTFTIKTEDWSQFLDSCKTLGWIEEKEGGIPVIHIPVVYVMVGRVNFTVRYLFQNPDNPAEYIADVDNVPDREGYVDNTRAVSLIDLDESRPKTEQFLQEFRGCTITKESNFLAYGTQVLADGSSIIELKYDRNIFQTHFSMKEGNSISPVSVMCGANMLDTLTKYVEESPEDRTPTKMGYSFDYWSWDVPLRNPDGSPQVDADGHALTEEKRIEATDIMPDRDIVVYANWTTAKATIYYQYWIQNPDTPEVYTPYSSDKKYDSAEVDTGSRVGDLYDQFKEPIPMDDEITFADTRFRDFNKEDGAYFKYNHQKTIELNNAYEVVKGDGSTIVNLYFDRKEFTVEFHIGKYYKANSISGWHEIAKGGSSTRSDEGWAYGYDWATGFKVQLINPMDPEDKYVSEYDPDPTVLNDTPYTIKARYGQSIYNMWPTDVKQTSGSRVFLYWGAHKDSGIFRERMAAGQNPYISGVYGIMDKGLIVQDDFGNPKGENVHNHLVAIFRLPGEGITTRTYYYHYMEECTIDTPGAKDGLYYKQRPHQVVDFGKPWGDFSDNSHWKEISTAEVELKRNDSPIEPVSLQGHECVYVCRDGKNYYYFYAHNRYDLSFSYIFPGDVEAIPDKSKVSFTYSYLTDDPPGENVTYNGQTFPLREFDPYKHISGFDSMHPGYELERDAKGNVQWYIDAERTKPIPEGFVNLPRENTTIFGKWLPNPVTLTLNVPNGQFSETQLNKFFNNAKTKPGFENIKVEQTKVNDTDYKVVISGLPKHKDMGIHLDNLLDIGPVDGVKIFSHWTFNGKNGPERYVYDEKTDMVADLELTAAWKPDMSGVYTVEYVSTTKPDVWTSSNGTIIGKDPADPSKEITLYRLRAPVRVTGVEIGKERTVNVIPLPEYHNFIPNKRQLTKVIDKDPANNVFYFYYEKSIQDITYKVHYVLIDEGQSDYGTGPLPLEKDAPVTEGGTGVLLAKDKVVTRKYGLNDSVLIQERAVAIPGYTVRYRTEKSFLLSNDENENHIYFYYDKNKANPNNYPSYTINFYFSDDGVIYDTTDAAKKLTISGNAKPEHIIDGLNVARHPESYVAIGVLDKFEGYIYNDTYTQDRYLHVKEKAFEGENVLDIYMKKSLNRIIYKVDVDSKGNKLEEPGWLHWNLVGQAAKDIVKDSINKCVWHNDVTYGNTAILPTDNVFPDHPAYEFKGWKRAKDNHIYQQSELNSQPWFTSVTESQETLTAVMEPRNINVFYTCYPKGGIWKDNDEKYNPVLDETNYIVGHYELRNRNNSIVEPAVNPIFRPVQNGEKNRAFAGWSRVHPETEGCIDADGNIVSEYVYDFSKNIDATVQIERIYAVWNPQPYTFIVSKSDLDNNHAPLQGATFKLTRLLTDVDAPNKPPATDSEGNYIVDTNTEALESVTDANGKAEFKYLVEGYYKLEETPPIGYRGIDPVIICAPDEPVDLTPKGAFIYGDNPQMITIESEPGNVRRSTIKIGNQRIYKVQMKIPQEINYTYNVGGIIWDPVNLKYVLDSNGTEAHWETFRPVEFEVRNVSINTEALTVKAHLEYDRMHPLLYKDTIFESRAVDANGNISDFAGFPIEIKDSAGVIIGYDQINTLTANNPGVKYKLELKKEAEKHLPVPDLNNPSINFGRITIGITPDAVVYPFENAN